MAKKRGLLAEINHQQKQAAKRQQQQLRERQKMAAAEARQVEKARKEAERAYQQAQRAGAAEQKRLEKVAKEAHVAAMNAEVNSLNAELEARTASLESLLHATLDVDDYVDLDSLKQEVIHPPLNRPDLDPQPAPPVTPPPPQPEYHEPATPSGIAGVFGKKQHAKKVQEAQDAHQSAVLGWQRAVTEHEAARDKLAKEHLLAENERAALKEQAVAEYRRECEERERLAETQNLAVDTLIANLGYGVSEAIEEYVSIVVSNSVYPDDFEVSHDFEFSADSAELKLDAAIPTPTTMPTVKTYKYVKASDEIKATDLSQKAQKDLYSSALYQVALRTLHEVFEADRRGLIKTIALTVGTEGKHPATGVNSFIPLLAVSAEREEFMGFDLAEVEPSATLAFLSASISKNPFALVEADVRGVRKA